MINAMNSFKLLVLLVIIYPASLEAQFRVVPDEKLRDGKIVLTQDCGKQGTLLVRKAEIAEPAAYGRNGRSVEFGYFLEKPGFDTELIHRMSTGDGNPPGSVKPIDTEIVGAFVTQDQALIYVELEGSDRYEAFVKPPHLTDPHNINDERFNLAAAAPHFSRSLLFNVNLNDHYTASIQGKLFDRSLTIVLRDDKSQIRGKWGLGDLESGSKYGWGRIPSAATQPFTQLPVSRPQILNEFTITHSTIMLDKKYKDDRELVVVREELESRQVSDGVPDRTHVIRYAFNAKQHATSLQPWLETFFALPTFSAKDSTKIDIIDAELTVDDILVVVERDSKTGRYCGYFTSAPAVTVGGFEKWTNVWQEGDNPKALLCGEAPDERSLDVSIVGKFSDKSLRINFGDKVTLKNQVLKWSETDYCWVLQGK